MGNPRRAPRPFAVAFGLFVAEFLVCAYWIVSPTPVWFPDSPMYEAIGANLAAGNGFSADLRPPYRPEITRTPVVPYLVAGVYSVAGRRPAAVVWLNALWVAGAVAVGYLVMLRLSRDPAVAASGGAVAVLTPFIGGSAATIATEPVAMLQVTLAAWLLLRWREQARRKSAALRGALIGLLLASVVLNRVNLAPAVAVGALCFVGTAFRAVPRRPIAWATTVAFALALVGPVVLWSARNASVSLRFSPEPVGLSASRVYDIVRYREAILGEEPFGPPPANVRYFRHWRERYGPEDLLALERENRAWLEGFLAEHGADLVRATPARLVGLFSSSTVWTYPLEDPTGERFPGPVLRWVSRGLWTLSFLGFLALWSNRTARWVWLVPVVTLVPVHLMTVCSPRYMRVLMPLLLPYAGAFLVPLGRRLMSVGRRGRADPLGRTA